MRTRSGSGCSGRALHGLRLAGQVRRAGPGGGAARQGPQGREGRARGRRGQDKGAGGAAGGARPGGRARGSPPPSPASPPPPPSAAPWRRRTRSWPRSTTSWPRNTKQLAAGEGGAGEEELRVREPRPEPQAGDLRGEDSAVRAQGPDDGAAEGQDPLRLRLRARGQGGRGGAGEDRRRAQDGAGAASSAWRATRTTCPPAGGPVPLQLGAEPGARHGGGARPPGLRAWTPPSLSAAGYGQYQPIAANDSAGEPQPEPAHRNRARAQSRRALGGARETRAPS